jgi:cyclopropane fatty-acyl-phospholipid synthase-like methyltransferase
VGLPYDAAYVAAFYDALGEREWERHEATWAARFSFALHTHYLRAFVQPGDRVLEIGAGPGRFTIELARLGARIHVADLSSRQLALNAERVTQAGCESAVVARSRLDVADLSSLDDASFDVVVCYGGPLSYLMDRAERGVAELVRVSRPGGHTLLSVMSLLGSTRAFLPGILGADPAQGTLRIAQVLATGDLPRDVNGHECHLFRWRDLQALLGRYGTIVAASAANFLSVQNEAAIAAASAEQRARLLEWELELGREPGALDGGTHILAVVQRPV